MPSVYYVYSQVFTPQTANTVPYSISDNGVIAGYYGDNTGDHGFIDLNGNVTTIDDPSASGTIGTQVLGANSAGMAVGVYYVGDQFISFLDDHGVFTDLTGPTGAQYFTAASINDSGVIAGYYTDARGGHDGFVIAGGQFTTIDDPSASTNPNFGGTWVEGINNAGVLTGYYSNGSSAIGFVATPKSGGGYTFADVSDPSAQGPGEPNTYAQATNQGGTTVGAYYLYPQGFNAFVETDGVFTTLAPPVAGVTWVDAQGVNDAGEVVGYYIANGVLTGFMATPISGTFTTGLDHLTGGSGDDTFLATGGTLTAGDQAEGGGGSNTILLQGGGVFDLRAPTALADFQTITAAEGQPAYAAGGVANGEQTLWLRAGMDVTVNVVADDLPNASDPNAAGIVIYGADDHSVINLGPGADRFYVGGDGETVNGDGGHDWIYATPATLGANLNGGGGNSILYLSGGGTVTLGSNIQGFSQLVLQGSSAWTLSTNTQTGLEVIDYTGLADTITLTDAGQSVGTGNGSQDRILLAATTATDLVNGAGGGDTIEIVGGGQAVLNPLDKGVSTVVLDQATTLFAGPGVGTILGSTGADTIQAGGKNQVLTGGGGADTLIGDAGGYDTFRDTAADLNGVTIKNFGYRGDAIDVTDIAYPGWRVRFTEDASNTFGVLTVADNTHMAKIVLFGQYSASGFFARSDGASGELITYSPPIPQAIAAPARLRMT